MATEKKGIVLNRMYVGDYLSTNIGHEVINMFKSDENGHYIYLNSRGNLAKEHHNKISDMLLIKYHTKDVVEVISKAEGLEEVKDVACSQSRNLNEPDHLLSESQKKYIHDEQISYNGASIIDIFEGAGQQNIYITYKAAAVHRTKKSCRIFIRFQSSESDNAHNGDIDSFVDNHNILNTTIKLEGYQQAKASLKQYIYPNTDTRDYENLMNIIKDSEHKYWEPEPVGTVTKEIADIGEHINVTRELSIFDICQIQNDENRFSYALKHFMEKYPQLWQRFFKQYDIELSDSFTVTREENAKIKKTKNDNKTKSQSEECKELDETIPSGGRIDLLIRDENNIIVIENKIKSDINSTAEDKEYNQKLTETTAEDVNNGTKHNITQLDRYVNYINWCIGENNKTKHNKDIGKKAHFFILAPNYNVPDNTLEGVYKVIKYNDLYQFLKTTSEVNEDVNFKAFFEAMHRHTHNNVNDYLYYDMLEKFVRRINEVNEKNKLFIDDIQQVAGA